MGSKSCIHTYVHMAQLGFATCYILIEFRAIFLNSSLSSTHYITEEWELREFWWWCLCRRERSKVPYIVRQCLEEIERRGMEEVGIYRVSGVATDIQALKTAFDTSECSCLSRNHHPGRIHRVPCVQVHRGTDREVNQMWAVHLWPCWTYWVLHLNT